MVVFPLRHRQAELFWRHSAWIVCKVVSTVWEFSCRPGEHLLYWPSTSQVLRYTKRGLFNNFTVLFAAASHFTNTLPFTKSLILCNKTFNLFFSKKTVMIGWKYLYHVIAFIVTKIIIWMDDNSCISIILQNTVFWPSIRPWLHSLHSWLKFHEQLQTLTYGTSLVTKNSSQTFWQKIKLDIIFAENARYGTAANVFHWITLIMLITLWKTFLDLTPPIHNHFLCTFVV